MRTLYATMAVLLLTHGACAQTRPTAAIATDLERLAAELRATTPEPTPAPDPGVIVVPAGANLQTFVDAAQPGAVLALEPGVRYPVGPLVLPAKPFGPVITITTNGTLPNRRITPADRPRLATIAPLNGDGALHCTRSSSWRLDGLAFESVPGGFNDIIRLQDCDTITLDRLLIVAGVDGQKRAITGNGRHITLTRSHIANIFRIGQESHAFMAYDGAGPYTLTDNYLEAASINILFGGADAQSADRMPCDILVDGNHLTKRAEWRGQPRVVKNLFELKAACRVVASNNLLEKNWADGQSGSGVVFTPRNQDGTAPWSRVEDVLFERNVLREMAHAFNITGYDDLYPSGRLTGLRIRDNLVVTYGWLLQAGGEAGDVTVEHNTVVNGWTLLKFYTGGIRPAGPARPATFAIERFVFRGNIANLGEYGIHGEGASGLGTPALTFQTRAYVWEINVVAGPTWIPLPPSTYRPSVEDLTRVCFVDTIDYRLTAGCPYAEFAGRR